MAARRTAAEQLTKMMQVREPCSRSRLRHGCLGRPQSVKRSIQPTYSYKAMRGMPKVLAKLRAK